MPQSSTLALKPLDQQVIVITGATSGIGLVTARRASARGAAVWLVARDEDVLRKTVEAIRKADGRADYSVADVGDLDEVQHAAAAAVALYGRIDTWVNNAGVVIYAKLIDKPKTATDNLQVPAGEGNERSPEQAGRKFSLFSSASHHRLLSVLTLGAVAMLIIAGVAERRLPTRAA